MVFYLLIEFSWSIFVFLKQPKTQLQRLKDNKYIEMKKNTLIVALLLSFTSFETFSQSYEEIYAVANQEVQSRIDQNKIQGINILTGVVSNHTVGFTGVGFSQKENLENKLQNIDSIISFELNSDNTSVIIQSTPDFTKETIQSILNDFQSTITGYNISYSVDAQ